MPELPEVETVVRTNRPRLIGRRIVAFESHWPRQARPNPDAVRDGIVGRTIRNLSRRAKWIVFDLDDGSHLLVHLRMSGRFGWSNEPEGSNSHHIRATWDLDNGQQLCFHDARKFGRIVFTRDFNQETAGLGVEPLDRAFTTAVLTNLLHRRARRLKPLLLDQSVIAGLGNIYTDEALFRAGLHPLLQSDRLNGTQIASLRDSIRHVLRAGIRHNGTSIDWVYPEGQMQQRLMVYGRAGEPCRRCGAPIRRLLVGQRSTHICPTCQPKRSRRANRTPSRRVPSKV